MAATAQGRPLPARRPGSRRAQRARIRRRRLGLLVALLAAAAIGLSTTFASGPTAPAESRPLSDQAALAGQPAPQTLATRGSLQLMVPIDQHVITGVVFHRYDGLRRGLALARRPPAQRRPADAHVERRVRRRRRRPRLQRRLRLDAGRRHRRPARALPVYSPADGQVVSITPYVLNGDATHYGQEVAISPSSDPSLRRQDRAHRAHRRPARQADAARRRAGHRRPHASSAPSST